MRRAGAAAGELVYVTGSLGEAGLALLELQGRYRSAVGLSPLRKRLDRPCPRVKEGRALRGLATAAIDISDGLVQDLQQFILYIFGTTGKLQGFNKMPPARINRRNAIWSFRAWRNEFAGRTRGQ